MKRGACAPLFVLYPFLYCRRKSFGFSLGYNNYTQQHNYNPLFNQVMNL